MVQNYITEEVFYYVLADDGSDLSGEESESDSDEEMSEDPNSNLDKEDDIHFKKDTVGSDPQRQKMRVRGSALARTRFELVGRRLKIEEEVR